MHGSNAHPNDQSDAPMWYFLAECSISEFLSALDRGDQLTAGLLARAMRELGMSPEWVENIEMTLAEVAKNAPAHFGPGRLENPGQIRIFCQKKIIDEARSARAASQAYQDERAQAILDSEMKRSGGWGYFIVDRGDDFSLNSVANPHNGIELYLYKEGN